MEETNMSANIDTMLYVREVPWHGLGHQYMEPPTTPEEIITGAELGWSVNHIRMKTDLHESVGGYHAIYREDNNTVLGVVNKSRISHVQNSDMFNSFVDIIGKEVDVETAASLGIGETVFGCFKIKEQFKVLDDTVDHYLVVVNDHLKCDGKVTVLNTPVRVVCNNTLSEALSNHSAKIRIPLSSDSSINAQMARKIIASSQSAIEDLSTSAEKMVETKVDKAYVEKVLDELFPYIQSSDGTSHERANEAIAMKRNMFVSCMGADDLANYRGTEYQVFNAITDFSQHYYSNPDKSADLNYRMSTVIGVVDTTQLVGLTSRYMKSRKKLLASVSA